MVDGFDVINPFYCYEGGKISMEKGLSLVDPISIERSALVVRRGWVPAKYREKSSRPREINSKELIKINGCYMPGKNVHEYTVPNNPDANDWNNLCLEDITLYWDLPNFDEAKYYYFHCVDICGENDSRVETTPVMADSIDEVVNEHY